MACGGGGGGGGGRVSVLWRKHRGRAASLLEAPELLCTSRVSVTSTPPVDVDMLQSSPTLRNSLVAAGALVLLFLALASYSGPSSAVSRHVAALAGGQSGSPGLGDVANQTLGVSACPRYESRMKLTAPQFQRIYAINLPSRTDHKDSLSLAAHFSALDITYADGVTEVAQKALPPGEYHHLTLKLSWEVPQQCEQFANGVFEGEASKASAAATSRRNASTSRCTNAVFAGAEQFTTKGGLKAWRAHMNVLREMVNRNISTALIMEDDADWDVRIKSQLGTFARAARLLTSAIAAGLGTKSFEAQLPDLRGFVQPSEPSYSSPYGNVNEWDVFWLGHCGQKLRPAEEEGRAVISNDETVAESQHLHGFYGDSPIGAEYPNHTRIVARGQWGLCTIAYAVTNRGAQKLLYELSVRRADKAFDILLEELCDGTRGRPRLTCLTVMPPLFSSHRPIAPKSSFSNIDLADQDAPVEYTSVAYTENIRLSTKGNLEALIYGMDYTDLLMNGQPRLDPDA